jgi:glycosyltransferase involved in cell wall biosynthesis
MPRSVCLIAGGMGPQNIRLQPWRYLGEVARGLAAHGHAVLLVSDGEEDADRGEGVVVRRLSSIHNWTGWGNSDLQRLLRQHQPEVIIWHTGLLSFMHQDFNISESLKSIGIFTSPIYRFGDLIKLGPGRLLPRLPLIGAHLAASCLPHWLIRARIERSRLDILVVQTRTTLQQLQHLGVRAIPVSVIPPGVDPEWRLYNRDKPPVPQSSFHLNEDLVVFVYFGPVEQLRGFDTLMKALAAAWAQDPAIQLQVMVRKDAGLHFRGSTSLAHAETGISCPSIQIESNLISSGELAARVAAADVVALPFELVSSDAPLSLIEAAALGKPLVTTDVACLPELAAPVPHFFALRGETGSLVQALLQAAGYVREARAVAGKPINPPAGRARTWQEVGQAWSSLIQSL